MTSRSTSPPAASPRSSGRTAPARPRCSMSSRASRRRARAAWSSPERTSPDWRRKRSRSAASCARSSWCSCSRTSPCWRTSRSGAISIPRAGSGSALLPHRARHDRSRRRGVRRAICLSKVGLDAHADTLAGVLPYGQKRLLEIARALAAEPKLLMLDEPAAGLNRGETTRLADADPADRRARRRRSC